MRPHFDCRSTSDELTENTTTVIAKLDFPQSGDVAERLSEAFQEDAGDFHHLRVVT